MYACGENLIDVIMDWNHNIDERLEWLILDDYDENYNDYYDMTRPVESFDEIMEILKQISDYYPEESYIIRFE